MPVTKPVVQPPVQKRHWSTFRKIRLFLSFAFGALSAWGLTQSPAAEEWNDAEMAALVLVSIVGNSLLWWFVLPLLMGVAVAALALFIGSSGSSNRGGRIHGHLETKSGSVPFSGWWSA